jgi:hypothetical protein
MDDAMTRIDQRFDAIERRLDRLEERMDRGFEEIRGQLRATNRQLTQIGWGLLGAVFVQLIVVLIAVS